MRIVRGGTVVTMDAERRVIEDGAVLLEGTTIREVGDYSELRSRYPEVQEVIGNERTAVLPGLIDVHGHAGHSLMKTVASDRPDVWMDLLTTFYFTRTDEQFWYADARLSALDRLRQGVTTSMSVMGSRPRVDEPGFIRAHAAGYAEVGVADIIGTGPSGAPYPHPVESRDAGAGWRKKMVSLQDMLEAAEQVISELHGTRGGLTQVFLTPFTILPSLFGSGPSTPYAAQRLTESDRRHGAAVLELAARTGTRIHSDAFGGHIRLAMQDPETAILGPQVHLQHCVGIDEEEIVHLASTGTHVSHAPGGGLNVAALLAQGVNVALTTDGAAPLRPFDLLLAARTAREAQVVRTGDRYLLPPGKLLEMITIDAARAVGMQDEIGSLEPGKRADLVLIDTAQPHLTPWWMPVHRLMYQATGADVHTVLVAGEVLLDDGCAVRVDEQEVIDLAQEQASRALVDGGLEQHLADPGWKQVRRVFC
ncbi:amidohydrolase family protein [Nesterenkonia alkaliphila]|uniref:Amidohydrolase family protein n=1 Tax=Nesterenkonia alkaliphila TaxID=1463631 RepID=A0A7K1UJW9_9MICC|nr:amidohydrolase family protein [Nesterenkonia alkaliphila]MVT26704.1 amidohydrolase family protein [Nesterenkonia alkaliphila]GFZ76877.1 hydrolase [Nesterenkonia alkaliphila]